MDNSGRASQAGNPDHCRSGSSFSSYPECCLRPLYHLCADRQESSHQGDPDLIGDFGLSEVQFLAAVAMRRLKVPSKRLGMMLPLEPADTALV